MSVLRLFLFPTLVLTGPLGSVRRSSSLPGMARSIAERCLQVQPFWLFIIAAHGLLVPGCATSGLLRGDPERDDVNTLVVRGLLRYQLNRSWYLISSPIIASDWTQPEGKGWIVPVGGGLGYSFRLGGQPMQVSLEGYYNAVKPQFAGEELLGDWTIRNAMAGAFP